jgi:hypothetical protein
VNGELTGEDNADFTGSRRRGPLLLRLPGADRVGRHLAADRPYGNVLFNNFLDSDVDVLTLPRPHLHLVEGRVSIPAPAVTFVVQPVASTTSP